MRIFHDGAAFDVTVLLEETGDFCFGEARVYTGDEEVGPWVTSVCFTLFLVTIGWRAAMASVSWLSHSSTMILHTENRYDHWVMRSYHVLHDSCRRALLDSHLRALRDEARHSGRGHHAHSEALLHQG